MVDYVRWCISYSMTPLDGAGIERLVDSDSARWHSLTPIDGAWITGQLLSYSLTPLDGAGVSLADTYMYMHGVFHVHHFHNLSHRFTKAKPILNLSTKCWHFVPLKYTPDFVKILTIFLDKTQLVGGSWWWDPNLAWVHSLTLIRHTHPTWPWPPVGRFSHDLITLRQMETWT